VSYFQDALIAAFRRLREKVPPTYKYFSIIVNILRDMRRRSSATVDPVRQPQHIVDTLKEGRGRRHRE